MNNTQEVEELLRSDRGAEFTGIGYPSGNRVIMMDLLAVELNLTIDEVRDSLDEIRNSINKQIQDPYENPT